MIGIWMAELLEDQYAIFQKEDCVQEKAEWIGVLANFWASLQVNKAAPLKWIVKRKSQWHNCPFHVAIF